MITLTPNATMAKDTEYKFSIYVRNPATPKINHTDISIAASFSSAPLGAAGTADDMAISIGMTNPTAGGEPNAGAGEEAMDWNPMYIRQPTLLLKTVQQSSCTPCDTNTIT